MQLMPIQIQVLLAWTTAKDTIERVARRAGDDRGELTAGVVFLVALAVAAVGIAAVIVGKINNQANNIP
jgi:hypothetical protein